MKIGEQIRIALAYVQLLLLVGITGSGMLFMHKHTTSSGAIVVHIHPYNLKKDPDAKHHHSDNQIHFLDVVFQGYYLLTEFTDISAPLAQEVAKIRLIDGNDPFVDQMINHLRPRAPPFRANII